MRSLVLLLMLLAGLKVGTQEYMYREATSDVIISAYRQRAIDACRNDGRGQGLPLPETSWAIPANVRLSIGKSAIDVQLWQTDHRLWNTRWRNPFIFVVPAGRSGGLVCEYDIVNGTAIVQKL